MATHVAVAGFGERKDVRRELPQVPTVVHPHLNDTHMKHVTAISDKEIKSDFGEMTSNCTTSILK